MRNPSEFAAIALPVAIAEAVSIILFVVMLMVWCALASGQVPG